MLAILILVGLSLGIFHLNQTITRADQRRTARRRPF